MDSTPYQALLNNGFLADGLSYGFTRNPILLNQYFTIREKIYMETFRLKDFSTHIDGYDSHENTQILVVCAGNIVVGGSRVTVHSPKTSVRLPMEADDFLLPNLLPHLGLQEKTYAEITRLALLPEFCSDGKIALLMLWLQFSLGVSRGCDWIFTVTPAVQARRFRRHFLKLGYHMESLDNVIVPDKPAYEGRKMYLAVTEIKNKMPILPVAAESISLGMGGILKAA